MSDYVIWKGRGMFTTKDGKLIPEGGRVLLEQIDPERLKKKIEQNLFAYPKASTTASKSFSAGKK